MIVAPAAEADLVCDGVQVVWNHHHALQVHALLSKTADHVGGVLVLKLSGEDFVSNRNECCRGHKALSQRVEDRLRFPLASPFFKVVQWDVPVRLWNLSKIPMSHHL